MTPDDKSKLELDKSFEQWERNFHEKNHSLELITSEDESTHHMIARLMGKKMSEIDLNNVSFEDYLTSRQWSSRSPSIFLVLRPITQIGYWLDFHARKEYRNLSDFFRNISKPHYSCSFGRFPK